MGSAKIIMTLWVRWKKPIMPLIELDHDDAKNAQDVDGMTGDKCIRVEMPYNSLMGFLRVVISMIQYRVCLHTSRHKLKILECLRVVFHGIK